MAKEEGKGEAKAMVMEVMETGKGEGKATHGNHFSLTLIWVYRTTVEEWAALAEEEVLEMVAVVATEEVETEMEARVVATEEVETEVEAMAVATEEVETEVEAMAVATEEVETEMEEQEVATITGAVKDDEGGETAVGEEAVDGEVEAAEVEAAVVEGTAEVVCRTQECSQIVFEMLSAVVTG